MSVKKIEEIIEQIKGLSALELSELVKGIEDTFGVSAAAQAAVVAAPAAGGDSSGAAEEKTDFKVVMKDAGSESIKVIKALRSVVSGLNLKEAKDIVVGCKDAPAVIKEGVAKEEAESMKKALEEAGATVELQ